MRQRQADILFNFISALTPLGIGVLCYLIGRSFHDWELVIGGAISFIYGCIRFELAVMDHRENQRAQRLKKMVTILRDYEREAHDNGIYEGLHFSPQSYVHNPEDMVGYPTLRPVTDEEFNALLERFGRQVPPVPDGEGPWVFNRATGDWESPS